jgi:hypothetical protein
MATIHCPKCTEDSCGDDHIYAILLPSESVPGNYRRPVGRGWVYVGRTENRVEDRFNSNFNPDSVCYNQEWVDIGKENIRLMHEFHSQFNPVKKEPDDRDPDIFRGATATYAEYYLSKLLEQADYLVGGDGRMAFKIEPRRKKSQT